MLETGQAGDAGLLHHLCKSVEREGCGVGADVGVTRVQFLKDFRLIVIVLAAGFEVKLPAVARDGHFHDLGSAFVNRGDAHVALDLLHHVFVRVAVAAERLDAGVGCAVSGFGGQVLGDGSFRVEAAFLAGVDAFGGFFDHRASGLKASHVRNNQLVGIALLF